LQSVLHSPGAASITSLDLSDNKLGPASLKLLLPLLRHSCTPQELVPGVLPSAPHSCSCSARLQRRSGRKWHVPCWAQFGKQCMDTASRAMHAQATAGDGYSLAHQGDQAPLTPLLCLPQVKTRGSGGCALSLVMLRMWQAAQASRILARR